MMGKFSLAHLLLVLLGVACGVLITEDGLRETYDYVVVGAGIGGLVVANRLSEDASVSVLLIEAGEVDDRAEDITVPGNMGWENPSRYEWSMTTTPQAFLDNRTRTFAQGRAVGGSTIMNGMCWTRGSKADFDAWEKLGNTGWGWEGLLPYFLKSENYTAHGNTSQQSPLGMMPARGEHGTRGPVQVSFPRYVYNQTYNFLAGIRQLGIPLSQDLNTGYATGANMIPSSILAGNQSRADARTAYLDPVIQRANLEVLTGYTVTQILSSAGSNKTTWDWTLRPGASKSKVMITGVELAVNSTSQRYNVSCKKEAILAAGAILSPVLLQISGFGPADHLRRLGVNVLVELPGVGSNLQDHAMVQPVYDYTAPNVFSAQDIVGSTRDAVKAEYLANRTGPWTAPLVNAVAFPALEELPSEVLSLIMADERDEHLPPTYDITLRVGYIAQKKEIQALLSRSDVSAYELMASSWGQLAVSAMHTLSRGTVHARSSSIFDNEPPVLDPRLCSHPFDCEILRMGIEFNGRLLSTDAMAKLLPVPPPGLGSEDLKNRSGLMDTIRSMVRTEFHPSGTAAMMPREAGGVVDTALTVYGTRNLRVVDASVIPLIPGGHLQAVVYAVAEKVLSTARFIHSFLYSFNGVANANDGLGCGYD
ncbi:GMC oxidoreductase-domain-containing protein [Xylaria sp. CBS 124048]|nr:GMC oxidoreductase-domain-containing protein [Xylaria sp. CBS 124048]